jgi:hypothetical protein
MDGVLLRRKEFASVLQRQDALERVDRLEARIKEGCFSGGRSAADQDRDALPDGRSDELVNALPPQMLNERLLDIGKVM